MQLALLATLLLAEACNAEHDDVRAFMDAMWSEGLPEGVNAPELQSEFTAADFPEMNFDGECGRAFHFVACDEPRAYWIRCDILPGTSELYFYEMHTARVTLDGIMSTTISAEGSPQ